MARKKGSGKTIGMTQISISLPQTLVEQIDKMAESDNRNRSNFIANTLQNLAREFANVAEPKKTIKQVIFIASYFRTAIFYGGFVFLREFFTINKFLSAGGVFCQPVGVSFENFFDFLSVVGPIANFQEVSIVCTALYGYLKFLGCPNRHFFSNIINTSQLLPFRKNNGGTVYFTIAYMNVGNFFLA